MVDHEKITWEVDIPLISNPNILGAWVKAMGATYLLSMLVLGTVFLGTGEWRQLPLLAGMFLLVVAGLTLVGLLIMLLVLGNRFRAQFEIDKQGVRYTALDRRARSLARLAVLAGALGGSAQTAGAGLLAVSQEEVALGWKGIFSTRCQPRRCTIVLRNQWRTLMFLYCTPQNYADVKAWVDREVLPHSAAQPKSPSVSPLPGALLSTALVVLACLPQFGLNEVTDLNIFPPILLLAFGLATVWLIPLFAWVILGVVGFIIVHLMLALTEFREYTLVSTYSYRQYETLDNAEWVVVAAALIGLVHLVWMSVRALRGHLVPVLIRDRQAMDG